MKIIQANVLLSNTPENGGIQQLCRGVENAVALKGESKILHGTRNGLKIFFRIQ